MFSLPTPSRPRVPRKQTGRIVLIRDGQVLPREKALEGPPPPPAQRDDGAAARTMGRN
jgi:hypothetical protein